MMKSQHRMTICHSRTTIAHDFNDLLTHILFIAVHRTIGTGRFIVPERALLQPFPGIIQKLPAVTAEAAFTAMVSITVHIDHHLNGFLFPDYSPGVWSIFRI